MKKAMIFAAAAFAAATVFNPLTAEATGTNRAAVVYKGSIRDWAGQTVEWKDISGCLKWGTILWKDECLQQPKPEAPEIEAPEESPEIPKPEVPEESPETPKPEAPEESPETPKPEVPEESPETPEQSPSEDEMEDKTYEEQVVELVNIERDKEGLAPLTIDTKIAAAVRAKEIQKSFSHTRPNGSGFSTALKEAGATYASAGENIAWGQKTPEEVVKAWMNSPGHRANIMNKKYSRIGVSHAKSAQGTSYWAQLFAD